MKKILYILLLSAALWADISLPSSGSGDAWVIKTDNPPVFNDCKSIANIELFKPVVSPLPGNLGVNPFDGKPFKEITGDVSVDVNNGSLLYKVWDAQRGYYIYTTEVVNDKCLEIDNKKIAELKAQFLDPMVKKIDFAQNTIDAIESTPSSDDTKSKSLAKTMSLRVDSNTEARNPMLGMIANSSSVFADAQTFLFLVTAAVAWAGMAGGYIAHKLQGEQNFPENYVKRLGVGIVIIVLLFQNSSVQVYGKGKIAETNMQAIWGYFLEKGAGYADRLAGAAQKQSIQHNIKSYGGQDAINDLNEKTTRAAELSLLNEANMEVLNQCINTYRVEDLKMAKVSSGGQIFPDTLDGLSGSFDAHKRYLKDESKPLYISLDSCGKAEKSYRSGSEELKNIMKYLNEHKTVDIDKKIITHASVSMNDIKSHGWVGIVSMPINYFVANKLGDSPSQAGTSRKEIDKAVEKSQANDCSNKDGWSYIACAIKKFGEVLLPSYVVYLIEEYDKVSIDSVLATTAQRASYALFPGVDTITTMFGNIFSAMSIVGKSIGTMFGFLVATDLASAMIDYLPFLVIIPVVSIAIAMYYAEVLIYTVTIPFMIVYAFSKDAWGRLMEHAARGLVLALKPAMIVISVFVAIFVADTVKSISTGMIKNQTAVLMKDMGKQAGGLTIKEVAASTIEKFNKGGYGNQNDTVNREVMTMNAESKVVKMFMGKFVIYFIQGLLHIAMSIVTVFIVAKIIVSGPSMIMSMFGKREADFMEQAEQFSSRIARYAPGL